MQEFASLALATVLLTLWAPAANASVGVGIQANPVRLTGSAHPGGSYALPSVYVINTGSEPETLSVRVERLQAPVNGANAVPLSWIQNSWSPDSSVSPGQAANIPLELVTPANAKPGAYSSDIVVTGSTVLAGASAASAASGATGATGATGIRFGAAAATGLEFRITPAPADGIPAWKLWTFVALIVIGAAVLAWRHLGLRIKIEGHRRLLWDVLPSSSSSAWSSCC